MYEESALVFDSTYNRRFINARTQAIMYEVAGSLTVAHEYGGAATITGNVDVNARPESPITIPRFNEPTLLAIS